MSDHEWAEFTTTLAGVLHRCPDGSFLILNAGDRFINFSRDTDSLGSFLILGVCENITEAGRQVLRDHGWREPPPGSASGGWLQSGNLTTAAFHDIARSAVQVLREVLEVSTPTMLAPEERLDDFDDFDDPKVPIDQLRSGTVSEVADEFAPLIPIADALVADNSWLLPTIKYVLARCDRDRDRAPWHRFLDALSDPSRDGVGLIAQFDRDDTPYRIRDRLQCLPSHPSELWWEWLPGLLAEAADRRLADTIDAMLDQVSVRSQRLRSALMSFPTGSALIAVTFVPFDQVDRLRAVTAAHGHPARSWGHGRGVNLTR